MVSKNKRPEDSKRLDLGFTIKVDRGNTFNSLPSLTASGIAISSVNPEPQEVWDSERARIRDSAILAPYKIAQMGFITQGEYKKTTELINRENRDVYTFTRDDKNIKVIPVKGNGRGLEDIIDISEKIYNYCDINGLEKDEPTQIDFGGFLDSLGYKRDEHNSHDRKVKSRIWKTILDTSNTEFMLVAGEGSSSVTSTSLFKVMAVYNTKNQLKAVEDYENKKPPSRFTINVPPELYYQMKGFRDKTQYIPKSVMVKGKIPADKLNKEYQGYKKNLFDLINLKLYGNTSEIRYLDKKELTEAIGGQESTRTKKLTEALDKYQSDKLLLSDWGFAKSKHKRLGKGYPRSPWVWIDRKGVDDYSLTLTFANNHLSEIAKEREARKQKADIHTLKKSVKKLERDL